MKVSRFKAIIVPKPIYGMQNKTWRTEVLDSFSQPHFKLVELTTDDEWTQMV